MPLYIVRQDITKMKVDAIVNAANNTLMGGGGVDGAIHRAAGPELKEECSALGGCPTGGAKLTKGYRLPAKYVIHTVGPIWHGGKNGEREALTACYRNSLALAAEHGCESVAFPLISGGAYGYPQSEALTVAEETIRAFLKDNDLNVYMTLFSGKTMLIAKERYEDIREFIDDVYAEQNYMHRSRRLLEYELEQLRLEESEECVPLDAPMPKMTEACAPSAVGPIGGGLKKLSLADLLRQRDESFQEALFRLIDERGMKDSDCYKLANLDRKLFSKIRSDKKYHTSKNTVVALSLALKLSLDETRALLEKAGYALNHTDVFDIIIEYCLNNHIYDVFEVNHILYSFDQVPLGNWGK